MTGCHMCGLPSWPIAEPGFSVKLRIKAETRFQRDRRPTVWCCSPSCAIQSLAVAEMGPVTHKWPISLAQFASLNAERIAACLDRAETYQKNRINSGAENAENWFMGLPHMEAENLRKPRRGGRPKKWETNAHRMRAYRQSLRREA